MCWHVRYNKTIEPGILNETAFFDQRNDKICNFYGLKSCSKKKTSFHLHSQIKSSIFHIKFPKINFIFYISTDGLKENNLSSSKILKNSKRRGGGLLFFFNFESCVKAPTSPFFPVKVFSVDWMNRGGCVH